MAGGNKEVNRDKCRGATATFGNIAVYYAM
jgi:hypothetical protein